MLDQLQQAASMQGSSANASSWSKLWVKQLPVPRVSSALLQTLSSSNACSAGEHCSWHSCRGNLCLGL
jgi:hypothetical protein